MSFLAPLFLAGAAAVALPFIFHLIRRSSRDRILFSSLMFLEPSPPRITKRSRLEHLLLLLLRCAVLCFLAFAFARPFLPKAMPSATAANQNNRIAVLVDTSASMRRGNLWTEAKALATDAVRRAGPSDALAVYTFDRQLHPVLRFSDSAGIPAGERAATVSTRLAATSPSWFGTHLGRAVLNSTEELLDQLNRDAKEQGNAGLRLVVVSDFQSGAHLEGLQGFEWPKKLQVQLVSVATKDTANASLQVIEENRRAFSSTTNQPVRVRVSNSKDAKNEQFTLQWRRGNDVAGERISVYVPAGQSRIVASPPRPAEASSLLLTGDQLDFDNVAWVAQPEAPPVTIAWFGQDAPDDPRGLAYYLHRAFEQTNLTTKLVAFTNTIPAEAQSASLLIAGQSLTPAVSDLARTLLRNGRTVLAPVRDLSELSAISDLAGIRISGQEAQVANYALFSRIDFQDPLFAPFADSRYNDFTKIHFWKYRHLNFGQATNISVIASLDSGAPLLGEIPVEKGRLLLCASTWMPSDSQLALSSKFVPLLFGILERSSGVRAAAHQFLIGDAVSLPPDAKEVLLPDATKKELSTSVFSDSAAPGIYKAGNFQFAVNLDPSESRLAPLKPEEFAALGVPLTGSADPADLLRAQERARHLLATDTEARQKLWRTFLIAAIAFVFLETFLSGRISRQVAPG